MQKIFLLMIALMLLALSSAALAQDDECSCGYDEEGLCLPCEGR